MSNTKQRIIAAAVMTLIACGVAVLQYIGIPAVKYLGILIVLAMILEYTICLRHADVAVIRKNWLTFFAFFCLLCVMLVAINTVGTHPFFILLLLLIICGADIGAWFFGRLIGGDKMWERLSAKKTWAGQIAGILCGTFAGVICGLQITGTFNPTLVWLGISIALLSQYGDLTASYIKRTLGIKDFGTIIPGHGGILDRFDGWIYALPIAWLFML